MIGQVFQDPNPTGNDLYLSERLAETYADLVQRRPVREQTMAALGLRRLPAYFAQPLPNRQLLEIAVVDTDPQRAMAVANELANQLILQSPTAPRPEEQEREAFINNQLASLQTNIEQTEAEITAKQAALESAFSAVEISELQSEIEALQTKLVSLQDYFAALLANTSDGAINTIKVIEPATLPLRPNDSDKTVLVLSASGLAFALAVATAYVLDYLDNTVRTREDVATVDGITHLPGIPRFPSRGDNVPFLVHDAPLSPVTDAFRALRTGLLAAMTQHKSCKIILITSAAPKEGKSIIAANLAIVLAEGGKRVRLIDADLRRPQQHRLFDVVGDYGLAELLVALEGHDRVNGSGEMIERLTHKLKPGNLGLIAAGYNLTDGARLLGSDTMKMLLHTVSQYVDYVIIDSPPLLAVADPFILSTQVDGVVLVASARSIPRKQVEQAMQRLSDANANVLGVVLNHLDPSMEDYQYYQYYHAYTDETEREN